MDILLAIRAIRVRMPHCELKWEIPTKTNNRVIDILFRNSQEKSIIVGIKTIKDFIRVPTINEENKNIKSEIIKRTKEMLQLEEVRLCDIVDFSGVMMQIFDDVMVDKDKIVLKYKTSQLEIGITTDKELIKNAINQIKCDKIYDGKNKLNFDDIYCLPIVDSQRQNDLKNYIDDLVFALYFSVPLKKVGLGNTREIHKLCIENGFYSVLDY